MRISDWSSDVCSSDLLDKHQRVTKQGVGVPSVESQRATITLLRLIVSPQLPEAVAERNEWLWRFRFERLSTSVQKHGRGEVAALANVFGERNHLGGAAERKRGVEGKSGAVSVKF